MKNIAILTESGRAVNSEDISSFSIEIDDLSKDEHDSHISCDFNVSHTSGESIHISKFYSFVESVGALSSLFESIKNGDKVWDVADHNSSI